MATLESWSDFHREAPHRLICKLSPDVVHSSSKTTLLQNKAPKTKEQQQQQKNPSKFISSYWLQCMPKVYSKVNFRVKPGRQLCLRKQERWEGQKQPLKPALFWQFFFFCPFRLFLEGFQVWRFKVIFFFFFLLETFQCLMCFV